jgi:cell division protein FtsL
MPATQNKPVMTERKQTKKVLPSSSIKSTTNTPRRRASARQAVHRREPLKVLLVGGAAFVGTLAVLLISVNASVTNIGYHRTDLKQAILAEEQEQQRLRSEIAILENGSKIAEAARASGMVRDMAHIHILKAREQSNGQGN